MSTPKTASAADAIAVGPVEPTAPGGLRTHHLILLIIAAASPLGVIVGNVPVGLLLGNGVGLPAAFLAAALVIACMVGGMMRLARRIPTTGGFADLARAGLGHGASLGVAYLTGIAYWIGSLSVLAAFGYFAALVSSGIGVGIPWWIYSLGALVLVLLLGRRSADVSAKLILVLMVLEIAVVLVLDVAIIANHGLQAFPAAVFSPRHVFSGHLGPALVVGFTSFIGVESAVLYTREAKDPRRSVPRATYTAVVFIALTYVVSSWLVIGSLGVDSAVQSAADNEGDLVFGIAEHELGGIFLIITQLFFVTSVLACFVALHNASARYTQTLASRGALPQRLGELHPRFRAPSNASTAQALIGIVLFAAFAIAGLNPYIGLASSLTGLFTVGIVAAQTIVSFSVFVYFRRQREAIGWTSTFAPALGFIGGTAAIIAIVSNYSVLTGEDTLVGRLLPIVLLLVFVAGFVARKRVTAQADTVTIQSEPQLVTEEMS